MTTADTTAPDALIGADLAKSEQVLHYWFGELDGRDDVNVSKQELWWKGGEETDAEIRELFEPLVAQALAGSFDHWCKTPRGCLALVIVLDQFTRCLGRGSAAAYAGDHRALAVCIAAVQGKVDQSLRLIERAFFYMPLMHAEDVVVAQRSIDTFNVLSGEIADCSRDDHPDFRPHAVTHADIVLQFGRYPHRNELFNRESTAAERVFMADGGPSFGQGKKS